MQPKVPGSDIVDRLIAAGRIRPARLDLADLGPPPEIATVISVSDALREQRDEGLDPLPPK